MSLPEGATLSSARESKVRLVESAYGLVALVEMTEYAIGEAMGAISKRTGAKIVLLLADGKADGMTVEEIETIVAGISTTPQSLGQGGE